MLAGPAGSTMTIAGFPASWQRVRVGVSADDASRRRELPCEPVSLYALSDPAGSIDADALLRDAVIPDPPYWALVWIGARAIAATVTTLALPASTTVLDLGCGLGLSGLAAARRGAAVTFGDYLEAPLEFVRATVARAQLSRCTVRRIDFTVGDEDASRYDLILAADIVYDPAHYEPLATYLDRHLTEAGTVLLTESLRADAGRFLDGMRERGFSDAKSALWVEEDGRRERTWLHELRRETAEA